MSHFNTNPSDAQVIAGGLVLFLISCYFSCIKVKYLFYGETTEARIVEVIGPHRSHGESVHDNTVKFEFVEKNGTVRRGQCTESTDWTRPESGMISIEYLPGEYGDYRRPGSHDYIPVLITVGIAVFLVIGFIRLVRKAYA